jgi:hypothetical protein
MHLSGQLSDWSIKDLLQIMQVTQKTGSLDIDGEKRGRVHFREGSVTGAELTGGAGSFEGNDRGSVADVLYVLSTLDSGSFSVGAADGPDNEGWTVEDVMDDVEALQFLEREVMAAGLFDGSGVRLVREITEPVELDPADWTVLVSLIQPFTFPDLEARMGRGGAVRLFHALHRLGVAEAFVDDEDESEWLDRLAEDISPQPGDPTWPEHVHEEEAPADEGLRPAFEVAPEPIEEDVPSDDHPPHPGAEGMKGVSAPASTTLTDGVYDEIRRLRSKVAEK